MSSVKTYSIGQFDLNPRGNLWAKDERGLGRRLLRGMGWSEGRGLGKREDGPTGPLRPRPNNGNAGIGFTERLPFLKESHEYDSVLQNLNKKFETKNTQETEEKSLEQRSQQFTKRLHYQKFVRGKDVGRYSQRDMDAIFAKRTPLPDTPPPDRPPPDSDSNLVGSPLSMTEYFAMKMNKKKAPLAYCPTEKESQEELPLEDPLACCPTETKSQEELPSEVCVGRYDAWRESQRTAARMRLYKGLVRRARHHPVLATANLHDLKGYANW